MNKNDESISLINAIVNLECNLENVLLKTNILASHLKNETLKIWIDKELNGYKKEDSIPQYRVISANLKGTIHDGYRVISNIVLPFDNLKSGKNHKVLDKVALLSKLDDSNNSMGSELPHSVLVLLTKHMNGYEVLKAWKQLPLGCFTSILSSIKSKLLSFLLNLKEEFGDNDISFINRKIDNMMEEKIGYNINANNVNMSFGDKNSQNANSGNDNKYQLASGDNIKQSLEDSVPELLKNIKSNIDSLGLNAEDKDEVLDEVKRVERQMKKQTPVTNVINQSLKLIYDILTGVSANTYGTSILEGISKLGIG